MQFVEIMDEDVKDLLGSPDVALEIVPNISPFLLCYPHITELKNPHKGN